MRQIGSNIKKLRKVKGLSQQAFGELFNLTRGNISSYEEFRAEPRIEVVLQIAKYFSIPVSEFLERQLTVNEILHFENHFVEQGVLGQGAGLCAVSFIGREYFQQNDIVLDLDKLPQIQFPIYHKQRMLAVENCSFIPNPSDFPFEEHVIIFFEPVEVEILHTLDQHFGIYCSDVELFFGKYQVADGQIELVLNDWKKAVFDTADKARFWKLFGTFQRIL